MSVGVSIGAKLHSGIEGAGFEEKAAAGGSGCRYFFECINFEL
ncbi:hypothetical protein [Bartonella tribocorum]|nr:hypothetical protein [Bartonella tribocorum]